MSGPVTFFASWRGRPLAVVAHCMVSALAAGALAMPLLAQAGDNLHAERHALLTGHVDAAEAGLAAVLQANPHDGAALLLSCRVAYAEGHAGMAVQACDAALNNGLANSSEAQDWDGRALGAKAQKASALSGFSLARRVRTAFEQAVQLDPHNAAAINDLAEFYIAAPGIVGGGVDKAAALADRVQQAAPEAAHRTRALVAKKRGDKSEAMREFHAELAVAQAPAAWVDLALYQASLGDAAGAVQSAKGAFATDAQHGAAVVDAATIVLDTHLDDADAIAWLSDYIASSAQSDAAPAFHVQTLLGDWLRQHGQPAAAREHYLAALRLFSAYKPAQAGLQALGKG